VRDFDSECFWHFSEESYFEDDWFWVLFFWLLVKKMREVDEKWEFLDNYRQFLIRDGKLPDIKKRFCFRG